MKDTLFLSAGDGGVDRWRSQSWRAIAEHLRFALESGSEQFEHVFGRLEDVLLDVLRSLRPVNAACGGRENPGEAFAGAGESLVRLSSRLGSIRCEGLVLTTVGSPHVINESSKDKRRFD